MNHHLIEEGTPTGDGFEGFDFNNVRDGVWFEGTAHMATAFAFAGQTELAADFRGELCRAQNESLDADLRAELPTPFDDMIGLPAGSHDGISTGFGFMIHRRLHIAATAWNVFAQLGFNPFLQDPPSPTTAREDVPDLEP
jgi:hypothetical protein